MLMSKTNTSTRRSFIWIAGAAFSAPLAAAAAAAPSIAAGNEEDPLKARLAMLEDVNAIRAVNQAYARYVNAGAREEITAVFADPSAVQIDRSIVSVAADGFEERDVIEIDGDRATAAALVYCTVDLEEVIGPSCPLVEMAREQGGGIVRRKERVIFEHVYVKHGGVWKIQRSAHHFEKDAIGPREVS